MYIGKLDEIGKEDRSAVGSKGANLGEMMKVGLPVPDGFVLTVECYKAFVRANGMEPEIYSELNGLDVDEVLQLTQISNRIKDQFFFGEMPHALRTDIERAYSELGESMVAVRFSSSAEDLTGFAFSGQYDSFLNINGIDNLILAIKRSWASFWSTKAIRHRMKNGINHRDYSQSVVVQKLINSEKSGVMFSANPRNGRRDQVLINSSWGLGDILQSREVNPDSYLVDKRTKGIIEVDIQNKALMTISSEEGVMTVNVSKDLKHKEVLNNYEIQMLLELAVLTERFFGVPQEIEWAFEHHHFYLVQTKDMTSLFPVPGVKQRDDQLRVFKNIILLGKAYQAPMTPLGQDFWRRCGMSAVRGITGKDSVDVGLIQYSAGRSFVDLTNLLVKKRYWQPVVKRIMKNDPIGMEILMDYLVENKTQMLNQAKHFPPIFRAVPFFSKWIRGYFFGRFNKDKVIDKISQISEENMQTVKLNFAAATSFDEKIQCILEAQYQMVMMSFVVSSYVAYWISNMEKMERRVNKWLGETADFDTAKRMLFSDPATEMNLELLKIAAKYEREEKRPLADDLEIRSFLKAYGLRSSMDADIGVECWRENPASVMEMIESHLDDKTAVLSMEGMLESLDKAIKATDDIGRKVEREKGERKARKVSGALEVYKAMAGLSEKVNFDWGEMISLCRIEMQKIGQSMVVHSRLEEADDIFFLDFEDILDPNRNLLPIVAKNKEAHERFKAFEAVPRLLSSTGESIYSVPLASVEDGESSSDYIWRTLFVIASISGS